LPKPDAFSGSNTDDSEARLRSIAAAASMCLPLREMVLAYWGENGTQGSMEVIVVSLADVPTAMVMLDLQLTWTANPMSSYTELQVGRPEVATTIQLFYHYYCR
jgi:hypothetical protein